MATVFPPLLTPVRAYASRICAGPRPRGVAFGATPAGAAALMAWFARTAAASVRCRAKHEANFRAGLAHARWVEILAPAAEGAAAGAAWAVAEPRPAAASAITPLAARRRRRATEGSCLWRPPSDRWRAPSPGHRVVTSSSDMPNGGAPHVLEDMGGSAVRSDPHDRDVVRSEPQTAGRPLRL